MSSELRQQLRTRTGEARERHRAVEQDRLARASEPLWPGDIFVLPGDAGAQLEWTVLERSGQTALVVPLDDQPFAGSTDLEIPESLDSDEGTFRGPATLRCGFAVELGAEALADAKRTGRLAPEAIHRARETRRRIASGQPTGTVSSREVDADPEYRAWIEDAVEPARGALDSEEEDLPALTAFSPPKPPRRRFPSWLAVAAAVLLALGAAHLWMSHQRTDLAAQRAEVTARAAELDRLERRLGIEGPSAEEVAVAGAGDLEGSATGKRVGGRESGPEAPFGDLVNLPMAVFAASAPRTPVNLRLPGRAKAIALVVQLDGPGEEAESSSRFRLSLARIGDAVPLWSRGDLAADGGRLNAILPTALLGEGDYRVQLARLDLPGFPTQHFTLRIQRA
ncbi:MAG: hypothetical protein AAGD06_31420 [Acidobacteriota bacterium]